MEKPKEHEPPEAIGEFLADRLEHVRSYVMANDDSIQTHGLKLLRMLCRAASHGRMSREMRARYEGLLKGLRPHIMAVHRAGRTVAPDVLSELERIRSKSRRGRPG